MAINLLSKEEIKRLSREDISLLISKAQKELGNYSIADIFKGEPLNSTDVIEKFTLALYVEKLQNEDAIKAQQELNIDRPKEVDAPKVEEDKKVKSFRQEDEQLEKVMKLHKSLSNLIAKFIAAGTLKVEKTQGYDESGIAIQETQFIGENSKAVYSGLESLLTEMSKLFSFDSNFRSYHEEPEKEDVSTVNPYRRAIVGYVPEGLDIDPEKPLSESQLQKFIEDSKSSAKKPAFKLVSFAFGDQNQDRSESKDFLQRALADFKEKMGIDSKAPSRATIPDSAISTHSPLFAALRKTAENSR